MLTDYLKAAKDIIFPSLCLCCKKKTSRKYLCSDCEDKITFLFPPRCRGCADKLEHGEKNFCKSCLKKSLPYHNLVSITAYREPMVKLLQLFKYRDYRYLSPFLSSLVTTHLSKTAAVDGTDYDFITAVPIHRETLKMRGYNQSELLAESLANHFKISFRSDIIYQPRRKISQTKLNPAERAANVEGVFTVKENLCHKKIILVDDIFTTGATAAACSRALQEKGSAMITVITLSKTLED